MHLAGKIAARHFLMHDAGAGRHPLHIARAQRAAVAEAVAMLNGACQNVSNGFDAAMRMPGETLEVLRRVVIAEIVHHQERVGQRRIAEAEDAMEMNAGPFTGGNGNAFMLYGTYGHVFDPFPVRSTRLGPRISKAFNKTERTPLFVHKIACVGISSKWHAHQLSVHKIPLYASSSLSTGNHL